MADTSADNTPARVWVPITDFLHRDAKRLLAVNPHPVPARLCEKRTLEKIQDRKLPVRGRTADGVFYEGLAHPCWAWRLSYAVIRDDDIRDSVGVILYEVEVCDPDKPPSAVPIEKAEAPADPAEEEPEEAPVEPAKAPVGVDDKLTRAERQALALIQCHLKKEDLVDRTAKEVTDLLAKKPGVDWRYGHKPVERCLKWLKDHPDELSRHSRV